MLRDETRIPLSAQTQSLLYPPQLSEFLALWMDWAYITPGGGGCNGDADARPVAIVNTARRRTKPEKQGY